MCVCVCVLLHLHRVLVQIERVELRHKANSCWKCLELVALQIEHLELCQHVHILWQTLERVRCDGQLCSSSLVSICTFVLVKQVN